MQNNVFNNFTEILIDNNLLNLEANTQVKHAIFNEKIINLDSLINLSHKNLNFCEYIKIILDKNIKINLLDNLFENSKIINQKIEIILQENSSVNYFFKKTCKSRISKAYDSIINKELIFRFVGQNSQAKVFCVIRSNKNNIFNIKTIQDHQANFTKSDLTINAILCQKSKLICDNLICVPKLVKKIEAKQINRNLLLSSDSRVISKPKLEVESDDVDCRHGAAMSRLDSEQLFFLQSRGLSYCQAKKTLINAFLSCE